MNFKYMAAFNSKITFLIIFFTFSICQAQSGWIHQQSGVSVDSLRSVRFINSQTGWIAGTNGIILKSTNGGNNWNTVKAGISWDLYSISLISDSIIFACGENGIIIKSTNSGFSWNNLSSGVNVRLNSIIFLNSLTGFSAGFEGVILKTINGGDSWTILSSGTDIQLNSVFFTSPYKGWSAGYGGIFNTSDGGSSWQPQFIDGSLVLNSIYFTDSLHGWSAYYDNNTFGPENVRTTSGGLEWINYSMNNSYSISVFFTDNIKGWSSGYYGMINFSTDGGVTWTNQSSGTSEHLNSVYFSNAYTGWCVGNSGIILKTTSAGVLTNFSDTENHIPEDFILEQNYPNPFNPSTIISYTIKSEDFVSLIVCDIQGKEVFVLINEKQRPGDYKVKFDPDNLSSGIYLYRLSAGSNSETKKMVLIR